jgi:hypothetical protein
MGLQEMQMTLFHAPRALTVRSAAIPEVAGAPALVPLKLQGREGVNSLFEYRLILQTPDAYNFKAGEGANFDLDTFIGLELTCGIELEGHGSFVPGMPGGMGANHRSSVCVWSNPVREAAGGKPRCRQVIRRPISWRKLLKGGDRSVRVSPCPGCIRASCSTPPMQTMPPSHGCGCVKHEAEQVGHEVCRLVAGSTTRAGLSLPDHRHNSRQGRHAAVP